MSDPVDETDTWTSPRPASRETVDAPPPVLSGRYRLVRRLAAGGMATVWEGLDEVLARTVAIKVLHEHLAADEAFRERFRREAVSAARLTHPNVVGLYDTGRDGAVTYLIMEYIDGATLKDAVAGGPLPISYAARVGTQVARALDYAHSRGLVHRDVKPANILLASDGGVKVTDFGIAKADQGDDLTRTGSVLGTAAYVAPEQIRGGEVTGVADQYALAVVLYEALTGQQPFSGETPLATAAQRLEHDPQPPRRLNGDIPRGLDSALRRALSREPADRFPSLSAFADALAPHADVDVDEDVPPPPARPVEAAAAEPASGAAAADAPTRRSVRHRLVAAVAALAVVVVGAVLLLTDGALVERLTPGEPEEPEPREVDLEPGALMIFDPGGEGEENDEDLAHLLDDDPETTWRTSHYDGPAFGGLKEGVGFVADLGDPQFVEEIWLDLVIDGVHVEAYVNDTASAELDDWARVAAQEDAAEEVLLEIPSEALPRVQYVLVWVTGELPASPYSSGQYTAEFAELSIRAQPPAS